MPDPSPGATIEEWSRLWCVDYLRRVERVMRSGPENLTLGVGIWQNVNPRFAERSRARTLALATRHA